MNYLEEAIKLAKNLNHPYVGTEHMVYIILKENDDIAEQINISAESFYGVDFDFSCGKRVYMCPYCKETSFEECIEEEDEEE